jgi:hypothetical protein
MLTRIERAVPMERAPRLTASHWQLIKAHYGFRCVYCGKKGYLTKDHLTPQLDNGLTTMSNIVPACQPCNSRKRAGPPPVPVQPLLALCAESDWLLIANPPRPRRHGHGHRWSQRTWWMITQQGIKTLQARLRRLKALPSVPSSANIQLVPTRVQPPPRVQAIPLPRSSLEYWVGTVPAPPIPERLAHLMDPCRWHHIGAVVVKYQNPRLTRALEWCWTVPSVPSDSPQNSQIVESAKGADQ